MWNFPLFPERASTTATQVDALFLALLAACSLLALAICGVILFLAVKYRRGARVDRGRPPEHNTTIEVLWIVVPMVFLSGLFLWGSVVFFHEYAPPGDAVDVYVVAKQWMWKLEHPEGKREINELHVPIGRPVRLLMTSEDVIHSFYVPAFRIKQDVLPGRYTSIWFQPTRRGRYHLFCAEYCGTNHSAMGGWVEVMEPVDYERWLSNGTAGTSMAQQGEALFTQHHCNGCHGASVTVHAPRLEGVYGRQVPIQVGKDVSFVTADDRYVRDSILLPKEQIVAGYEPIMPSFQGVIGEEDLTRIIAYVKSIGSKETPP